VQFHPEVDLSTNGVRMMENFLKRVCKCSAQYTVENREKACIDEIRAQAADKKVRSGLVMEAYS
jgi:GMP synthase (glutamine-hydrolysing)